MVASIGARWYAAGGAIRPASLRHGRRPENPRSAPENPFSAGKPAPATALADGMGRRTRLGCAAALAMVACVPRAVRERTPHSAVSCGELPAGFAPLLRPHGTVVIGDLAGTREVPELVGRIACHAAATGMRVRLVLEVPSSEPTRIDAYLRSRGDVDDRIALVRGPFWLRSSVASSAMLALVERVRECRAAGLGIEVASARDWAQTRPDDDAFELALLDRRRAHAGSDVALVVATAGGTRFACTPIGPCGVRTVAGVGDGVEPRVRWDGVPRGWDGVFWVGVVSASHPVFEPAPSTLQRLP